MDCRNLQLVEQTQHLSILFSQWKFAISRAMPVKLRLLVLCVLFSFFSFSEVMLPTSLSNYRGVTRILINYLLYNELILKEQIVLSLNT